MIPELVKVLAGCLALMIGASTPTLIVTAALQPCGIALLNPPTPRSGVAERQHQSAATDEHQNAQSTQQTSDNALSTQNAHDEHPISPKSENEGGWYTNPDWWVAGFTGALFVATTGLWIITGFLWASARQAIIDGEKAASAFEAIERPYFVLKSLTGFQVRREQAHREYVECTVTNIGRTPALLDHMWADFYYSDQPPNSPRFHSFSGSPILGNIPFGSGKTITKEIAIFIRGIDILRRNNSLIPNIEPGKALYFIVRAAYNDVSGHPHETGACRIYNIAAIDTFERYGGDDYNYNT